MARCLSRFVRLGILGAVSALAACGGDAVDVPAVEIQDSAGVRVVVNPPPSPDTDPGWTVVAEPELEIGALDGAPEYQLFRVSGAVVLVVRLGRDSIMVFDTRLDRTSVFTASGDFLRSFAIGREEQRSCDIGDDYLLGLVRDELDVERLRLRRLVKSSPASSSGV
jgi:hypothetical protein